MRRRLPLEYSPTAHICAGTPISSDIIHTSRTVPFISMFMNLEKGHSEHELGNLCFKNFYIFSKYKNVAEQSVKEYLEYFATNKATSKETKDIERQRQWYLSDNETRKRYMTWQQEIDEAVDLERERANAAERRADRYEKILREHGLL